MDSDMLKELAEEFQTLSTQAITCGKCKGEGVLEHPYDGADEPCPDCDDGEFVPEDKNDLPEEDAQRYFHLRPLVSQVVNIQEDQIDTKDADEFVEIASRAMVFDGVEAYARDQASLLGIDHDFDDWPLSHLDWNAAGESVLTTDYNAREITWDGETFIVKDDGS